MAKVCVLFFWRTRESCAFDGGVGTMKWGKVVPLTGEIETVNGGRVTMKKGWGACRRLVLLARPHPFVVSLSGLRGGENAVGFLV